MLFDLWLWLWVKFSDFYHILETHQQNTRRFGAQLSGLLNKLNKELLALDKKTTSLIKNQNQDYPQIEALQSIYAMISPRVPLPSFRGWALSPDAAKLVLFHALAPSTNIILETGSGLSTILLAYALEKKGTGKVISLEHDKLFYEKTKKLIKTHSLGKFVDLHYAPLLQRSINGKKYLWYDTSALPPNQRYDLFVVDGPPAATQKYARFPALPLLYDRLAKGALIILDDYNRAEEKWAVSQWQKSYPGIKIEYQNLEKGAAVITKVVS